MKKKLIPINYYLNNKLYYNLLGFSPTFFKTNFLF